MITKATCIAVVCYFLYVCLMLYCDCNVQGSQPRTYHCTRPVSSYSASRLISYCQVLLQAETQLNWIKTQFIRGLDHSQLSLLVSIGALVDLIAPPTTALGTAYLIKKIITK